MLNRYVLAPLLAALLAAACGPGRSAEVAPPVAPADSVAADTAVPPPETAATAPTDTAATSPRAARLPDDIRRTCPGAARLDTLSAPFPHLRVLDDPGAVIGFVVDSDAAGTTARGYGGPVPLRLFLDACARPRRVYILDNQETPAYLDIVTSGGLLDRLLEYDPARPESIAAVTLATRSSTALIAGVTATADRVARELVAAAGRSPD